MEKEILSKLMLLTFVIGFMGCVQQPRLAEPTEEEKRARAHQSAKVHTELAGEYFNRGQMEVALEEIDEALKAEPNYAPAHNVFGLINMKLNEDAKAMQNFTQAVKLASDDGEIRNNYGWFLCQRYPQLMDQAIEQFSQAINNSLYATPEMALTNAGICEIKRQRYDEAHTYLRKALLKQPNYFSALLALVDLDFQRGKLAEAKSKLTELMQNNSPTPESLLLAIKIEQAAGDQMTVDSYIFQLQKRFPDSNEAILVREGKVN